ncbi:MAG: YkgJ family cysteine cluster protein [Clostridiaceae bacterium]|nr:YkgJ family cysteine cluster protein [Clostridiaceae bacterium]
MIEPSKVKEAFNRIEDENYSFRAYLKNHADEEVLDEQFSKLHKELFLSNDCSKCRNCCKEYSASFKEDELAPVAAFLKIAEKDFRDKYIKEELGGYQLNVRPCCFLKEDGGCQIEACKPVSCRDYPYTDKPERLFGLLSIVDSTSICPVVFEIFERLKQEYRFKRRKRY